MQIKITLRYHLKPVRMAIIKKARNSECWQAYGEKEALRHRWWECEKVPPLVAQRVKRLPTMRGTRVQSLGREDLLEKEMVTHSSILAWKIPWTKKPGRLQAMGLQSV